MGTEHWDAANRALWEEWAQAHLHSRFYDVDGFRAGRSTLNDIELDEVGDVRGRRLLHLQCHFGLDTLSWARLGARVTGLDFSARAIGAARTLAAEAGIDAEFVEASVYDVADHVHDEFDIVFTSYGVLSWLDDIERWAAAAAARVAPGGMLYLVEFHPLFDMLGDDGVTFAYPYFGSGAPTRVLEQASYADGAVRELESFTWPHPIGEVVSALARQGLVIELLREHAWSPYHVRPFMEELEPGRWGVRRGDVLLPVLYSLRARRMA